VAAPATPRDGRSASNASARPRLDPVTRAWAVVTSAGVVRLALGFVASLVIARALGAADFGVYAVLAATVGLVGGLAEGGLTEAAVLRIAAAQASPASAAFEAADRARAFFWLRLALATSIVTVGCLLAEPIASRWLNGQPDLLRWALIGIVATAASGAVSAILQATAAFGRMSSLTLLNTALTAALAVVLAASGALNLLSALIVLGIGTSLVAFVVGRRLLPPSFTLRPPSLTALRHEAGHLLRTGRWLWLAFLFATLTANAEVLLLNQWAGLALVGAYALALNLASKADLVNHSLYTVLLPGVASLHDRHALIAYLRQSLARGALIAVGLLLLVPLAPPFINLVYGPDFAPAAHFFQLLVGVMIFDVLATPVLLLPLAYRQPRLLAAGDATRAVVLVATALALIPLYGAPGAIGARFASRVAGAVVVVGLLWLHRPAFEIQHEEPSAVAHERPAT
jgi:O-antigen/teichoic acid export membrane protein